MSRWFQNSEACNDIVVSSRVRLARNLRGLPFPQRMTDEQRRELCDKVEAAIREGSFPQKMNVLRLDDLTDAQSLALVERHLISPNFLNHRLGSMVLLSEDESISIMVGEEDHIRIQVMDCGDNVEACWEVANLFDDFLDERLGFAFDESFGYLTACPTNLGTGLRCSVMVHLPLHERAGSISELGASLSKVGFTLRGTYGESTGVQSSLYQISNQVTLGVTEHDCMNNLKAVVTRIITNERAMRQNLPERPDFIDAVWRAKALLTGAYRLTYDESLGLFSTLRLGISCGLVDDVPLGTLNTLLFLIGANNLITIDHDNTDSMARDIARATLVRDTLRSEHN